MKYLAESVDMVHSVQIPTIYDNDCAQTHRAILAIAQPNSARLTLALAGALDGRA